MKKYIKKIHLMLFLGMLLCFACTAKASAAEVKSGTGAQTETTDGPVTVGDLSSRNNTDVVLVMDASGSMLKADPGRLAIEGAKLFVDMEKVNGVSLALVEFSNELRSTGMIEMQQRQNKEYLKTILDEIEYGTTAHTDTGAAMLEAVSVLEESKSSNDKAIVLFTDGRTDIDAGTPGRTTEDSQKDVQKAVKLAAEKGYTIYCIGLNSDGSVDKKELKRMASRTGGKYHIAASVEELRDFFNSIFVDIDDTKEVKVDAYKADGTFHASRFTVDNSNVAEANIVILSSRQIKDVRLTDSDGKAVNLKKDENVYFSSSAAYSMIKLIRPKPGEWTIRVRGVSGDRIKIGMIYNFDLSLLVEADRTNVPAGQSVTVRAYLASDGEPFAEKDFYQKLSGRITARAEDGRILEEPLSLNESADALIGTFTPPEASVYEVTVHVEGNSLFRDSSSFTVAATEPATEGAPEPETEDLPEPERETDFETQTDDKNETESMGIVFPGILAVAVLLATAVLTAVFLKKRSVRLAGSFQVSIDYAQMDENGVPKVQTFDVTGMVPASQLGHQGFTAEDLLKAIQTLYLAVEYDSGRKAAFVHCLTELGQEPKRVKFRAGSGPFALDVKKSSDKVLFYHMGMLSDRDAITVSIGTAGSMAAGAVTEQAFGLRFLCGEAGADEKQTQRDHVQINIIYRTI